MLTRTRTSAQKAVNKSICNTGEISKIRYVYICKHIGDKIIRDADVQLPLNSSDGFGMISFQREQSTYSACHGRSGILIFI